MKNEEIISCNDMLLKVFSNIEENQYKEKNDVYNAWKKIITSIKKGYGESTEELGEKLFAHSSLIELKNEILLIETDHPCFIQMFRIYEKYILNGLKKFIPQLPIKSLSFRLKGSSVTLNNKKQYSIESEKKYLEKQFQKNDQFFEKMYGNSVQNQKKEEVPEEIQSAFARMKKSMLTKNKK